MRGRSIPRITAIFVALLIGGCSAAPQHSEPSPQQGAALPAHRMLDRFCFDDCMASQAGQEFCEDRCTY